MIGKFPARLDDKKRLFVPAKLRQALGDTFYVTLGVNCGCRCLTIYTREDWQRLEENFNNLPIAKQADATSLIFFNATECTPDKQFRFALTQPLLSYAGIDRDVVILGRAGRAEIWDEKSYERFEQENLTAEKLMASLEAIGL